MDLLASSPHLMLVEPISKDHHEFLLLYREAHKLKFVPHPTIEHKAIAYVFNEINGHTAKFPQTMVDLTIEKTIEKTTDNTTNLLVDNEATGTTTTNTDNESVTENREETNPKPHAFLPTPATFPYPNPKRPPTHVENPYKKKTTIACSTTTTATTTTTTDIPTDETTTTTPTASVTTDAILYEIERLTQQQNTENEDGHFDYREYCEQANNSQDQEEDDVTPQEEILTMLSNFVKYAIHTPLETFLTSDSKRDATRRIKQATVPTSFKTAAQRIAKAIGKEPKVDHPTLTGLIKDCTKKQNTSLELRLKQLKDQLDTIQNNNPATKKPENTPKNWQGSSHLIWNRTHPSRNSLNLAPADTQRFQYMTPRSNNMTPRSNNMTPRSNTKTPQSTINQPMTIVEAAPNTLNEPVRKQIQNRNQYQATSWTQTVNSPNAQPLPKDSEATPNASNEPIRKQGWNRSTNKRRKS